MVAGTGIGLAARGHLPQQYHEIALAAVGLGTLGLGLKMFTASRNVLIPVGALIFGGLLGHLLGLQAGIEALGAWAKGTFGGGGRIEEAFVTTSILFCVGPMTLRGCLEDGLEGKIHLLGIKSILDGISSVLFAAALGWGVLLSAVTVLVVQGTLTLSARRLRPLLSRRDVLDETTAAGGGILLAIGIGLLGLRSLPSADFLPALVLAGAVAWRFGSGELEQVTPGSLPDE